MRSWSGKEMQQSLKTSKELFDMSQKLFKHSHWDKSEILRSGCMFTQVQMARVSRKCVLVILIDFACSSWLILHVHLDWFCMFIVHWGPNDKGQQGRKYVLEILIDLCKFELFLSFLGLIRLGESLGWCSCTGVGSRLPAMFGNQTFGLSACATPNITEITRMKAPYNLSKQTWQYVGGGSYGGGSEIFLSLCCWWRWTRTCNQHIHYQQSSRRASLKPAKDTVAVFVLF